MADTIREQIIAAMITRFQGIKKASGYKSDLGNSVHHFRGSDYDVTELPALNVVDGRNDIGPATSTQFDNMVDITLEIKVASGETTYKTAYDIIEDVYRAIAVDDTWGGLALDTLPGSDEIETEHAGKIISGITIKVQVQYEAGKWRF
ncbi:MAG: hypothetical protein GXX82_16530 [Syntrophorhabdus sp.]|nr:hypothetical protein [Syntrophorhabdus sp.]